MVALPQEFISRTRQLMGEERFDRYLAAFDEPAPVSIRLNPLNTLDTQHSTLENVPWCPWGYYLPERPNFTFDPLLHAGCYYVQEAASMFLYTVLQQYMPQHPIAMLDLCAAPGGKSTLARSILPEGSVLFCNEPVRSRANILLENIQKWGYANCYVTNNLPRDYRKSKMQFDIILCDVPCSGEGMFRKDNATIGEWSWRHVEQCQRLQRDIVSDAWHCLRDGGLLVYSTCTFNTLENEENVRWIISEHDARVLPVSTQPAWGITGSLLTGFQEPVYRFIPGITRGEGLFMCLIQKGNVSREISHGSIKIPKTGINIMTPLPLHSDAPRVELNYSQAIAYLRREAIILPETAPLGIVEVCFNGYPLGMAKNVGTRANNLYPKEWKIKSTHVPQQEYVPIFR